jgi:hypothetical protein
MVARTAGLAVVLVGLVMLLGAPRAEAVPSVSYECTPAPLDCTDWWYRSDVSINWTVLPSDAKVLAGCQDKTLTTDTTESTEYCQAEHGSKTYVEVPIKVDQTPPVVTGGAPVRGPDFGGWYNHPIAVAFSGRDLTSGVDSCTAPTYAGPDGGAALLFGTCIDKAGNVSSPFGYGLSYDATAPPIQRLKAVAGDRRVTVSWRATGEAESVEVVRSPGLGSEDASVVFRGPGRKFEDDAVSNRRRYVYEIRLWDAAGNTDDETVAAVPHPHLLSPIRQQIVRPGHPPLLKWTAVRRARYYNVQLFRNGRKILSVWPTKARFRLKKRWAYAGLRRRLEPGRYRWLVFPGFGPRSENDYGDMLGPTAFRVSRSR